MEYGHVEVQKQFNDMEVYNSRIALYSVEDNDTNGTSSVETGQAGTRIIISFRRPGGITEQGWNYYTQNISTSYTEDALNNTTGSATVTTKEIEDTIKTWLENDNVDFADLMDLANDTDSTCISF